MELAIMRLLFCLIGRLGLSIQDFNSIEVRGVALMFRWEPAIGVAAECRSYLRAVSRVDAKGLRAGVSAFLPLLCRRRIDGRRRGKRPGAAAGCKCARTVGASGCKPISGGA